MLDPSEVDASELRPLDRKQFHRLGQLGFWEDERVELLEGVVVQMSPIGLPHNRLHWLLVELLVKAIPPQLIVTAGGPLAASKISEPLPDIAIVPRKMLKTRIPSKALLVVEVAQSSLRKDRGVKARIYAKAGVRDYWVVNAMKMTIEVHRKPSRGRYRSIEVYGRSTRLSPRLLPDIVVRLDDLLK